MVKELAIFDLDGVILNSKSNMETAWMAVQQEAGVKVPFEDYFNLIGIPFREIIAKLGIGEQVREIETIFRVASMENLSSATFYDGVEETLNSLSAAGIKLGVVTSKDRLRTNAVLALLTADFVTVQTPMDGFRGKPAPDSLLLAMAEANTDPSRSVYIGDMDADREAAKRAKIDYYHAKWGYGVMCDKDCICIDQISALLDRLVR